MNPGKRERWALVGAWIGSIVTATLGAAVGVLLAALFLALKPVETVKAMPKEADRVPGQVYFEPGTRDSLRAKTWTQKKRLLAQGSAVDLTFCEDELNAWLGARSSGKDKKDKEPVESFTYEGLNFHIADGVAQVACTVQYNQLSTPLPLIVQARGGFEKQDEVWMYVPHELWVGSFPVHRFPFLMERVIRWQKTGDGVPEVALKVREHIAEVTLVDRLLRVRIQ